MHPDDEAHVIHELLRDPAVVLNIGAENDATNADDRGYSFIDIELK
jgi:hypothetical protein